MPSKSVMEKRLSMVETGDLRADSMTDMAHLNEDEGDIMKAVWDGTGNLKLQKTSSKVPMPSTTEQ